MLACQNCAFVEKQTCYIQLLSSSHCSFQALYQKAEALYAMGEFEFAMVFYHRGNKLRPELEDFKLGIQKAQEAIENCVGSEWTLCGSKKISLKMAVVRSKNVVGTNDISFFLSFLFFISFFSLLFFLFFSSFLSFLFLQFRVGPL